MNATATAQPRRRRWGVFTTLRHLATGRRHRVATVDARAPERAPHVSRAQRNRLAAGLPFDGSDCD